MAILFSLLPHGTAAGPHLQLEPAVWDFGALTNQQEIIKDFAVRNDGDAVLKIDRVISSCNACLTAGVNNKSIQPGSSGLLRCRLDLRRLAGNISRTVTITANDPACSAVLNVFGLVVPLFEVTPPELLLDMGAGQETALAQILPLVLLHKPFSRVQLDNTNMIAQITTNGPSGFTLTVAPSRSLPRGRTNFLVTLSSDEPSDPRCYITGHVSNPPDFEVTPPALELLDKPEPQTRILWVQQHGATPMTLVDVLTPSRQMQVTVEPDASSFNYRLELTAILSNGSVGKTEKLQLKLRDSSNHEQLIPIPITVKRTDDE